MSVTKPIKIIETYSIGLLGGLIFLFLNWPLPWILGPMTTLILWKSSTYRDVYCPNLLKNSSFIILGIYFGLSFTKETFLTVGPYLFPFLLTTCILVAISIANSIIISKFTNVDVVTSVFASIPGGLSEMVAASESLNANTALVTIFQTVRLLTVVFLVPFSVLHLFPTDMRGGPFETVSAEEVSSVFSYGWFILCGFVGWLLRKKLPAAFVIAPLLTTGVLNVLEVSLPGIPVLLLIFAQLTIGISLGSKITIQDIVKGGKYCGFYFGSTIILILVSFGLGYLLSAQTVLDLPTAMLSLAPGGLVEMVLTATAVKADPAIVSSLQFIRLLFIIIVVPALLKWWFGKKSASALVSPDKHKEL
ncbi:AbrB family transcriptional regulator [Metabacillus herbersteinensis]|uniref:AbrB family transcriptional regulator n=1 Tax=Metabacillus herbersteinensis TaxID=283816 RepID=A0ABV6GAU0_9BACI